MPPSSLVLTPKDKSEYIYKCIKLCINHTTATLPDAIKSKASGKKSTQQTKPYQKVRESENLVKNPPDQALLSLFQFKLWSFGFQDTTPNPPSSHSDTQIHVCPNQVHRFVPCHLTYFRSHLT